VLERTSSGSILYVTLGLGLLALSAVLLFAALR